MPVDKPAPKERRKYHHKSRNGCAQCKQRHIKCDESKPRCANCIQANRVCSFLGMMPSVPSPGDRHSRASSSTTIGARISTPPTTLLPTVLNFSKFSQTSEFSLMDLAMLNHFTSQTSRTLSLRPETQELWATTVVEMAFHHRFLLHGLFAVSALHAAYTGSENARQLVDYASQQQTISLRLYQLAIANPTEEQYDAVFALSILIFVLAIAMASDEYREADMLDCKWIRLARGIRDVNCGRFDKIKKGPMALLIYEDDSQTSKSSGKNERNFSATGGGQQPPPPPPPPTPHALQHLENLWRGEDPLYDLIETDRQTYDEAFSFLRHTYSAITAQGDKFITERDLLVAEAFFWIFNVSERYIELLEQHHPIALVLFAHYAALFGEVCQEWFSESSAQAMVTSIWALLDEKSRKLIEGPMAAVKRKKSSVQYK